MLLEGMAEYADQMTVHLIKNLGLSSSECSEFWHFVKEHKRKLSVAAQEGLKNRNVSTELFFL
jgi:hypothetical protein